MTLENHVCFLAVVMLFTGQSSLSEIRAHGIWTHHLFACKSLSHRYNQKHVEFNKMGDLTPTQQRKSTQTYTSFLYLGFLIYQIIFWGEMLRSHNSVVLLLVFLGWFLLAGWCLSCFGGFGGWQGLGRGEGLLGYLLLRVGCKSGGTARDIDVLTVVLAILRVVARSQSCRGFIYCWRMKEQVEKKCGKRGREEK